MPVVTIEQTSVFPPSNCIIPSVTNKKVYQTHMSNTNNSRKEYEWIYLQTMIRSENW